MKAFASCRRDPAHVRCAQLSTRPIHRTMQTACIIAPNSIGNTADTRPKRMLKGIARPMESQRNNGWIHRDVQLPTHDDGNANGLLFAWHVYQGVLLCHWNDFVKNRFNVYWMRIADDTADPWMDAMEKFPTKEDADMMNCVLAKNCYDEISVTGYHQFSQNSTLSHWKRLPTPPSDYRELRKRY